MLHFFLIILLINFNNSKLKMIEEYNDLNLCLANLFMEISILIAFYFTSSRENDAIAIKYRKNENYVYYWKKNRETTD